MKEFFYRLACGVVIGIGCVLPGVSGGIMAISMGLYERMMAAIAGFFKSIKRNFLYLLPIGIGGVIGILLTSNALKIVIEKYEGVMLALFAGLVLGSIPELFVEARGPEKKKFRKRDGAAMFCGLAVVLLFALGDSASVQTGASGELTVLSALIAGGVLSVGTVIPGVSSSFLLIYIGLYGAVLNVLAGVFDLRTLFSEGILAALSELWAQVVPLVFMTLGFAAVAILLILGVNRAMKKYHTLSYYAIIGFVIGSFALIAPRIIAGFTWLSPVAFLTGVGLSLLQLRAKLRAARNRAITAEAAAEAAEDVPSVQPDAVTEDAAAEARISKEA